MEAEALARMFHDSYELLAPHFGYETRKASAVPWEQVPQPNRDLMIAVCRNVMWPALAAAESRGRAEEREAAAAAFDARQFSMFTGQSVATAIRARGAHAPTPSDPEKGAPK